MIELILNVIAVILFLAVLWLFIYYTIGSDLSGTNPSAVGTTTMILIMVLITILLVSGIVWFVFNTI